MSYESPSAGVRWLESQWLELRAYRFEWVAAGSDGIVAHDRHLGTVLSAVPDDSEDIAIAFVHGQEFEILDGDGFAGL